MTRSGRRARTGFGMLAASIALVLSACSAGPAAAPPEPAPPAERFALPAEGLVDYQLGGASEPSAGVTLVVRDATDEPAPGMPSICYLNGFQTQPGELESWLDEAPEAVLRTAAGDPVIDPNWPDEALLDPRTPEARAAIVDRLGPLIDRCAERGFVAVEFDNLDSYTRSGGVLTADDALALASLLVDWAHDAGLAAGQKNALELGARGRDEAGFDFAVLEECDRWAECAFATAVYGDQVLNIEYADDLRGTWAEVCARGEVPALTVLRDRMLAPPSSPDHVLAHCAPSR
ncbi:endo alpha-1,4 polygalactosaminidase [Microcella humidisoli]|uniref:Endo alpha-1,4 polygalactosaminidase n=1 Tax=Microcella humidisoli TaxID=2963406 RepID=A0ABY5G088_9MICO|nr:endo alpha-1,4 polygalactosaminidase [Microcella humidisoli]UTT63572.1 endo alpha-1,4 polygalactosaminidase [Microcella humidisoli]